MTSKEFIELSARKGFELRAEYYSNQYYGAIDWIVDTGAEFVRMFTDTTEAIDNDAIKQLNRIRRHLMLLTMFRRFLQRYKSGLRQQHKKYKHYILVVAGFPVYLLVSLIDGYYKKKSREEWETQKFQCNGSEMGLYFKRTMQNS